MSAQYRDPYVGRPYGQCIDCGATPPNHEDGCAFERGAELPECMAPDGAEPCAAYTALLNEAVELRKLCALVAAFSSTKLREHSLWILADAVDQAKALLSSSDSGK